MLWLLFLFLALPAPAAGMPAPSSSATASQNVQPARIQQLLRRPRERRIQFDPALQRDLVRLAGDVRLLWSVEPARERECAEALLDLAGMFLDFDTGAPQPDPGAELQRLAFDAL